MAQTFFFYDLETSGLNARDDRIMQFAGQRTGMNLEPIGEPVNMLIAMSDDTLPNPGALMVTGITPQKTVDEGYTEAEFCRIFTEEIATPDTTIVGYNNIRFDDEFMRAILWRNFFDPYEWSYAEGRSRWDMLDVIRMTRALRPKGIEWPVADGKPSNRLELLTKANGIEHASAHDALSDVSALISIAKLVKMHQPDIYEYLYKLRDKNEIKKLVDPNNPTPFVYTSGRYDAQYEKTAVAYPVADAEYGNVYVYDLRSDPSKWIGMSSDELRAVIQTPYRDRGDDFHPLPIKKLQYNRCPAVAPLGVLEQGDGWKRIELSSSIVQDRQNILHANRDFIDRAVALLNEKPDYPPAIEAEGKLYDGFVENRDKLRVETVRNAGREQLAKLNPTFTDHRLSDIYPRYVVRNFSAVATAEQRDNYEAYRTERLHRQTPSFIREMQKLTQAELSPHQQFVVEELQLWYESVAPPLDSE